MFASPLEVPKGGWIAENPKPRVPALPKTNVTRYATHTELTFAIALCGPKDGTKKLGDGLKTWKHCLFRWLAGLRPSAAITVLQAGVSSYFVLSSIYMSVYT